MTMACCHKEYAKVCEILVYVDAPAPRNPGLYQRLRFGLLASSWLPIPLGVFLWSALHVMLLIVGGPVFWLLSFLTAFLFCPVFIFGWSVITYVLLGLIWVAMDLVLLLVQSIRFCWSLVGFLACHEPIVEWRGGACLILDLWKDPDVRGMLWFYITIGVPCMRGSLYKETKDRMLKTWARWFEEVVHMHDAIVL